MAKAADAFRTISEVADEIGIPKHVLRFWEGKFPQVRPMKRGGGRRFYRPEDMELLRGICQLLHNEGYTIKGVQKILRRDGVEAVKAFGLGSGSKTPGPSQAVQSIEVNRASGKPSGASSRGRTSRVAREPLPPAARQTIKSILDELVALKAMLKPSREMATARMRGAA
jgi:DNA-binding transcriptional MerR regulator